MTEEMKMILALIRFLGLSIKCTGSNEDHDVIDEPVDESRFVRGMPSEYTYTIARL